MIHQRIVRLGALATLLFSLMGGSAEIQSPAVVSDARLEEEYNAGLKLILENRGKESTFINTLRAGNYNSEQARLLLGNLYLMNQDQTLSEKGNAAITQYDLVIKANPKFLPAYVNRGVARMISVEPEDMQTVMKIALSKTIPEKRRLPLELALKDFDEALRLEPKSFPANHNKGLVLEHMGRQKEAVDYFDRAINIGAKRRNLYGRMPTLKEEGEIINLTTDGACFFGGFSNFLQENMLRVSDGRVMGIQGQTIYPKTENDFVAFAYDKKAICFSTGDNIDYRTAIKNFDKAIALNPDVPWFYKMRSLSYIGLGDIEKARADAQKAIEILEKLRPAYEEITARNQNRSKN